MDLSDSVGETEGFQKKMPVTVGDGELEVLWEVELKRSRRVSAYRSVHPCLYLLKKDAPAIHCTAEPALAACESVLFLPGTLHMLLPCNTLSTRPWAG